VNTKDTLIAIRRLEQFYRRAVGGILREPAALAATCARSAEPVPFAQRHGLACEPVAVGDVWGRNWESGWFHLVGRVPETYRGRTVVAHIDLGGEGLVYRPDGRMLQGITNGSVFDSEFGRDVVRLFDPCAGGEPVELWVEAAANGLFGMFCDLDPGPDAANRDGRYDARVNTLRLAVFDTELWHLTLDLRVLLGLVRSLPERSVRRARIVRAAVDGLNAYATSGESARAFREILARELKKPAAASSLAVTAVGHAHIDTAWLWPVRETIRKCARTFATQLDLLARYPDYVFGASQPQHYAFVKEHYPELYAQVRAAVKAGRWEPQGGMWVEADCNVTGGESLVRQILHGKNFFRDEFGVEVDNLWLPDVFGYSAALPQLLRKSGIDYFLTQKLSWNQTNEFPHHTFRWQGIDGSEVLTHFPPENTYNSQLHPESLAAAEERFRENDYLDEFLCLFGVGDGGGGPKEEHIEMGRRQADLEGAPRVRFGPAREFFRRLAAERDRLPTWTGELYLELHRGTLTTQAYAKWANRRLEHKLRALEMLAAKLPLDRYPQQELDAVWKTVLLNQFHDIIPGSSIGRVYRVAHTEYREALAGCERLAAAVAAELYPADGNCLTLVNTLHYPYEGAVTLPAGWAGCEIDGGGPTPPCQREPDGVAVHVSIPPYAALTLRRTAETTAPAAPPGQSLVLENDLVRYELAESGALLRCFDKALGLELVVPEAPGNILTLYEDRPNDWDAWDIDAFYRETPLATARAAAAEPLPAGDVRRGVRFRYRIGRSHIVQTVRLGRMSRRLDFETAVDWREKHRMLRVAFPVTVRSDYAAFDIQYGYLRRATHRNTSWEQARFEVVGHRYADLSDRDHGVALLNDCKYGYRVENGLLDLNLLRAPNYPDPDADQGEHRFTYSLLPHPGDLAASEVMAEAARLNQGLLAAKGVRATNTRLPVRLSGEGVVLETVKKAEKDAGLILRVAETHGRHSTGRLEIDFPNFTLEETDLMERAVGRRLEAAPAAVLRMAPFEIRTLRLTYDTAQ